MTDPNNYQIGGNHYNSSYQHWDFAVRVGMSYLEGYASKYLVRWRQKEGIEGIQDLEKALHAVQKLHSVMYEVVAFRGSARFSQQWIYHEVSKFVLANDLPNEEARVILYLAKWSSEEDLIKAEDILKDMFEKAKLEQAVEAKPVPLTEENHHTDRANCTAL